VKEKSMSITRETEVATRKEAPKRAFDVERIRADFPALHQDVKGKPLVYLDNAASAQKPRQVLDAMTRLYSHDYANIHRGVHELSERATRAYENARLKALRFLNAASEREIVFVRGTTEGINLVAQTYGRANVGEGDEVLITHMEHHSNIVPWQILCEEKKARLRVVPIDDRGDMDMDAFSNLLGPRTRIVSLAHVSNALGTINPVRTVVELAHEKGVPVLIDGAQAAPHLPIDVAALGCDFYTLSGHKMFGPSGIGVLYGKEALLEKMPPYQGGGDMIASVTFEKTTYNRLPFRFEAGTPDIAGVVGLGAAIDYLTEIGLDAISAYEEELLDYGTERLHSVPGLRIIGEARHKASVLSFVLDGVHPHDIGTILDQEGIAVRTGHHCAQPVMDRFNVPATARASLALYNTREEIDRLVAGLHTVRQVFGLA
jgi:cysteine desulfurase/selenocysteine lyase